jgi:large subunit ribosomal protein L4
MKWNVVDNAGSKVKDVDLPDSVYSVELKEDLLHKAVKVLLANKRQGTHATKTRSLVSGGGKKPFKQKGTGNARQGSSRSPLMEGGAVSHGPQPRDYRLKLNKKMRDVAMNVALSDKVRNEKLLVLENINFNEFSTKKVLSMLSTLGVTGKSLIVTHEKNDHLYRSARNIPGVKTSNNNELCLEDILLHDHLIIAEDALKLTSASRTKKGGESA